MNSIQALTDILHSVDTYIILTGLCSLRLFVTLHLFPPTSDTVLQGVVRNALVMMLSAYVAYGQPVSFAYSLSGVVLVETTLREGLIGLVLGFAASIVFWVAEGAGTYIDDLTGYNNVQISNPTRSETSTPTSTLLGQVAVTAFWAFGGMTFLLGAVFESYHWWPVAQASPNVSDVIEAFTMRETDTLMQLVAKLAAPMILILILIDFAFAFAAKSAAKLDLMMLSMPVKGAMTVLMLALFVGLFVDQVRDQLTLKDFATSIHELAQKTLTDKPSSPSATPPVPAASTPSSNTLP